MNRLLILIRGLSARTELAIVLAVAFGWSIVGAVLPFLRPAGGLATAPQRLGDLLAYEAIVLLLLGGFLFIRGWSAARVGLAPTPRGTLVGAGMALVAYGAYALAWFAVVTLAPSVATDIASRGSSLVAAGIEPGTILVATALHALFEELFVCGYLITALADRHGARRAINASVAVRLAYHLYQGPLALISVIPIGLIFAWSFTRTRQLWPLIVAHALFDVIGLLAWR